MDVSMEHMSDVDDDKRQARLEQLAAVDADRMAEKQRRRKNLTDRADPQENVKLFVQKWNIQREDVNQRLEHFASREPACGDEDRHSIKSESDSITCALFDLEGQIASASYFLPAFEVRNSGDLASEMRSKLDAHRARLLPRKKFSFSKPSVIVEVKDPMEQGLTTRARLEGSAAASATAPEQPSLSYLDPATTISGLKGVTLNKTQDTLTGRDWMIADCEDCVICLHGPLQALYLHRLKNCRIQAGPVSGATFGEDIQNSTVMVASHQVRLHKTVNSTFYIQAGSDPIIEHSSGVMFAPLESLPYDGYSQALAQARIVTSSQLWKQVQDFQYPGSTQSPNWGFLPLDQHRQAKELVEE